MPSLKQKINLLDLECIKFQLVSRDRWPLAKADHVEILYKAYLHILATRTDVLAIPSIEIDEFWHSHILDTEKYWNDCEALFGHYLHHFPYLGVLDESDTASVDSFQQTRELLISECGLDPFVEWTAVSTEPSFM